MLWVHFGRPSCCENRKKLKLQEELCFIEMKSFAAIVSNRLKGFVFPGCSFSTSMMVLLLASAIPSNDKIFAHDRIVLEDKVFSLGSQTLPLCCCFFACFIETASYQRAAYSPDLHCSNLFIIEFS